MFPKPTKIHQHITHSECEDMIERGWKSPFTFSNLFKAPPDYTYEGRGKDFEDYVKGLGKRGKSFNIWRYVIFLRKEILLGCVSWCLGCFANFLLPLTMEEFLRWIDIGDPTKPGKGLGLLAMSFVLIFVRLIGVLLDNWYEKVCQILNKNIFEVKYQTEKRSLCF